jgi:D-alanyl-D-alanine dipeptidase
VLSAAVALLLLLAKAAPAARPPALVDVSVAIPDAILDLRYATSNNLTGHPLYPAGARCLLRPEVAARLARAAERLRTQGFRLRLFDCYRPQAAQRALFERYPLPGYVADPSRGGSHHSRGAAVDLGLSAADGREVDLPTDFDDFGPRARSAALEGVAPSARAHREALRKAMLAEGFEPSRLEWWHYSAPEAHGAPLLDAALAP